MAKTLNGPSGKSVVPNSPGYIDKAIRNVIAEYEGRWLCFESYELAKSVVPKNDHHKIYTSPIELKEKLGTKRLQELGRLFEVKSTAELWAKLFMNAYNPAVKYDELREAERSSKKPRVKRYKKKVAYKFIFDKSNDSNMQVYARLPPQACAIIDIINETVQANVSIEKSLPNVFTESELQGVIFLRRDDLNTRQDPWRIFQYYRGRLIQSGFLRYHHG